MFSKRSVTSSERLAVVIIIFVIATLFFSTATDIIERVQIRSDQYQQQVFLNAAAVYVVQQGFDPVSEDDADQMILYIREEDGFPALETVQPFAEQSWSPLQNEKYKKIMIERDQQASSVDSYRFTLVERREDVRVGH